MAERQLPKLNVAGSIPVSRSRKFATDNKPSFHVLWAHETKACCSSFSRAVRPKLTRSSQGFKESDSA